jgi:hypothetical protein
MYRLLTKGWKETLLINVTVEAVEKIPSRGSTQDSGAAGERTMSFESDDGLARGRFAWTVLVRFRRIVRGADESGVCATAMSETAGPGLFRQPH